MAAALVDCLWCVLDKVEAEEVKEEEGEGC
jgi:hypothetical protein